MTHWRCVSKMPDTTLDMTLTEAEKLLGVKDGYTHNDVQQAYRNIARKYHPDKWLDKPDDERKRATRIYERANVARRILLNPTMAKPESEPTPQHDERQRTDIPSTPRGNGTHNGYGSTSSPYDNRTSRYGSGTYSGTRVTPGAGTGVRGGSGSWNGSTYGRTQSPSYGRQQGVSGTVRNSGGTYSGTGIRQPHTASQDGTRVSPQFNRPTHTYDNDNAPDNRDGTASWATVGNSESEREKFNTAKSFADKFGQTKDPAEADYAAEYARYASSRYHKASDVLHWTSSIASTIVTLIVAFAVMSQNGVLQGMNGVVGANTVSDMQDAATGMMGGFAPLFALLIACLAKTLLYDMIVAHQLESALDRSNAFLHGIPFIIGGIAIACFGWYEFSNTAFAWLTLAFTIVGVIICIVHGMRHSGDEAVTEH
jgi:hypothetical protein